MTKNEIHLVDENCNDLTLHKINNEKSNPTIIKNGEDKRLPNKEQVGNRT